jgi:alpha-tubulin suppressor-like RCC1 family protein
MQSLLFNKQTVTQCFCSVRRRSFATSLYAVGEGWTGALGTGRFDETIQGHQDDDETGGSTDMPVKVLLQSETFTNIKSVAVGWGHTAMIANDQVFVTGRPHDFSNLLRLRRLPKVLRDYAVRQSTLQGNDYEGLDPTSLVGRFVTYFSDSFLTKNENWDSAEEQSIMSTFTKVDLPNNEIPVSVECSAGVTAVVTKSGAVYTFGLNSYGQCGVGYSANNVWQPQRVVGLSADYASGPRAEIPQSFPIVSVKLGLQHALCLNSEGELFAFGKGDRGQIGRDPIVDEQLWAAPVTKSLEVIEQDSSSSTPMKPVYHKLKPIQHISAGMLHSAALDANNNVFVWGKNVLPKQFAVDKPGAVAADSKLPFRINGLPSHLQILELSCGSHHTAFLLEDGSVWAVGVSSDTREPIHEPVMMIPPNIIELPVRQFESHMDRTTVVGKDGQQVLQVHLWKDPELQEYAVFTPSWVDQLLEEDSTMRIRSVHRGWIHTIIATD